ncbi:uncharacterized protein LOC110809281 [Carica papaya]|uniref:uncharacterized protein LOC110809281 n=1 Tax=Carica papaya TaxID=3649 RepID=UPI000B8CA8FD|nr:uncharacterized protein LOC110809281 [Carica papaya]
MSLNCLTCQTLLRTDSDREYDNNTIDEEDQVVENLYYEKTERNWSRNLTPPVYKKMKSGSLLVTSSRKVKRSHRRLNTSTGVVGYETSAEPKLERSVGMRREWSFEDLREKRKEADRLLRD